MNIIICDDRIDDRKNLSDLLSDYGEKKNYEFAITEYESGEQLCEEQSALEACQLLFLDINMQGMDGLKTAMRINEKYPKLPVVLVTAYMNYALDGYKVKASRFLLKDNLADTIEECMDDLIAEINKNRRILEFRFVEGTIKLYADDIIYIETELHKNVFYTEKGTFQIYKKLDELENELKNMGFVRAHLSFLVNMRYITKISGYVMTLTTGKKIPVPKARYVQVKRNICCIREKNNMTFWVLVFIAEMLEVKGTLYFFDTFMEKRDGGYKNRYRFFVYCGVLYLAAVTGVWIGMLKCILIILVMSFLNLAYYEVSFRQSFLFSIINYTMLVLIDYVTVLLGRGGSIQEKWFLQALISKTAFIILMLFIRRFSKTRKSYGLITGKEWFQFFCVPVFTVVGFILMFYSENDDMQNVFLFLSVGLVAINLILMEFMQNTIEKEERIKIAVLTEQNQKNRIADYQDREEIYERQRRKMHDYKNQLSTIQTLIKNGHTDEALSFTQKLTESIAVEMSAINTNHPVVNAVLNQKYRSMQEKHIAVILKVGDLQEICLEEEEIVILLSNLLDNAIRESEKVLKNTGKAVIHLKLECEDHKLIFAVRNPVTEKVEIENDTIKSKRGDHHGIGLLNVKAVVDKYGGDMVLSCDENEFKAVVIL